MVTASTAFLFLSLFTSLCAGHADLHSHRSRHRSALRRLRRQDDDLTTRSSKACQVQLAQDEIDEWQAWMQEGLTACTETAASSIADNDAVTQVVMCYRLGFIDQKAKQFGGELLVMQVGASNVTSGAASSASSGSAAEASTTAGTESNASAGATDAAKVGATDSNASVSSSSSEATAASSSAAGLGAAVLTSSAVPLPTATARMIRRAKGEKKAKAKTSGEGQGQFKVQVSWGRGNEATTEAMSLVGDLGSSFVLSDTINAPSFSGPIGDFQSQLIGSTHFTRDFPDGAKFDGKDFSAFAPDAIDLVGQAGTVSPVDTVLVDLSTISGGERGFTDVAWGLFGASSARSNSLTFDDQCSVLPSSSKDSKDSSVDSSVDSTSDAGGFSSTSIESKSDFGSFFSTTTTEQSTTTSDAGATSTDAGTTTSAAAATATGSGIGAAFVSSSAVPIAAAPPASSSAAAVVAATPASAAAASAATTSSSEAASSASPDATAEQANEASDGAAQLPGREIQVLPIGLGVFAGVSVLALVIVGIVTYERRKYRAQFRARKMAEQVAQAGGYGATGMRETSGRV